MKPLNNNHRVLPKFQLLSPPLPAAGNEVEGRQRHLLPCQKLSHLLPEQSRVNGIDVLQIQLAVRPRGDFVPVDVIVVQAHEHGLLPVNPQLGRQPMGRGGLTGGTGACQHNRFRAPLANHIRDLRKPLFMKRLIHTNQLPDSAGSRQLVQIRRSFALH